jgi:hypothetical protein
MDWYEAETAAVITVAVTATIAVLAFFSLSACSTIHVDSCSAHPRECARAPVNGVKPVFPPYTFISPVTYPEVAMVYADRFGRLWADYDDCIVIIAGSRR